MPFRLKQAMLLPLRQNDKVYPLMSRTLIIAALASTGLLSGWIPAFSPQTWSWQFGATAQAQTFNNADITAYAQSVLDIEEIRQQFYNDIKAILGTGNVPKIACNEPETYQNISREDVRNLIQKYCEQSQAIVTRYLGSNGTTRFNEITVAMKRDNDLKNRVQSELIREQQRRAKN